MLNISAKIQHCYRAAFLQHFISTAASSQRQEGETCILCNLCHRGHKRCHPYTPWGTGQGRHRPLPLETARSPSGLKHQPWPAVSADRRPNARGPSACGGAGPESPASRSHIAFGQPGRIPAAERLRNGLSVSGISVQQRQVLPGLPFH